MINKVGTRNRVLEGRATWRHLKNTVHKSCAAAVSGSATKSGDAAFSQITLGSLVIQLYNLSITYYFSVHAYPRVLFSILTYF